MKRGAATDWTWEVKAELNEKDAQRLGRQFAWGRTLEEIERATGTVHLDWKTWNIVERRRNRNGKKDN